MVVLVQAMLVMMVVTVTMGVGMAVGIVEVVGQTWPPVRRRCAKTGRNSARLRHILHQFTQLAKCRRRYRSHGSSIASMLWEV